MTKILIVGGSSGIGLATANCFLAKGQHVAIVSRTAVQKELAQFQTYNLDFTDEPSVQGFFKHHNDFDIVIITAMTPLAVGDFLNIEITAAKECFDKFWGIAQVICYAAKYCKLLKSIVVVSGAAAECRGAPLSYIAAASTAVNVLVESLAKELAPIRINAVSPGLTETPLYQGLTRDELQTMANQTPLQRIGQAQEVAEAIYFVALHPHITGSILAVDAGARLT